MAIWQTKSKRKPTGGKLKDGRKKRQFEKGREPTHTTIDEKKVRQVRTTGKKIKTALRQDTKVNYIDPKTKKAKIAVIKDVIENKSNQQFIKNNIITKGAIIKTDAGNIQITSRPGQDGQLNGVLVAE
ncbi:MAG: 30S ribosomal protein S8e [Candidatus Aenigmarchaeota archaeon]|nr:30S ribosomal protein S8e [Candidatus Aenigmarchaeota archaeon]MCK5321811.1 30S ribosomal protein S8e [Candidatus Aenigmarchaeota archaeon]